MLLRLFLDPVPGLVERNQSGFGGACRHHSVSGAGEMLHSIWNDCRLPQAGEGDGAVHPENSSSQSTERQALAWCEGVGVG